MSRTRGHRNDEPIRKQIREATSRKRRSEERRLLHKVLTEGDEDVLWPLDDELVEVLDWY